MRKLSERLERREERQRELREQLQEADERSKELEKGLGRDGKGPRGLAPRVDAVEDKDIEQDEALEALTEMVNTMEKEMSELTERVEDLETDE